MRALLDTCVLVPSLGRDLLLSIAVENAYIAHWSSAILDELSEVLHRKADARGEDPASTTAYVDHLIAEMSMAFPDALVATNYETLIGTFGLPDPDDEHVVAAAVICGATAIVSDNVGDMPRSQASGPYRSGAHQGVHPRFGGRSARSSPPIHPGDGPPSPHWARRDGRSAREEALAHSSGR